MVAEKMVEYFAGDVRRINHALKVDAFASMLARGTLVDGETAEIIHYAAILHDIGIKVSEKKYNSSAGNYQELEGPPIARKILSDLQVEKKTIDRVCFIIGNHHSYSKVDGIDFQIIIEADFLVNAFEDAMKPDAIKSVLSRIFKTETGKHLLQSMYLG